MYYDFVVMSLNCTDLLQGNNFSGCGDYFSDDNLVTCNVYGDLTNTYNLSTFYRIRVYKNEIGFIMIFDSTKQ